MPRLTENTIYKISQYKDEPKWMLELRLKAFEHFKKRKMPDWGPKLDIDFDQINWFNPGVKKPSKQWSQVSDKLKEYFEKIKIPEAEQKFLAGVEVQVDSSALYTSVQKILIEQGVIFLDTDTALKKYPDIFKEYFGKLISYTDNKFAALNTAVWSGGSFIYVPKGVKVKMPLHAFFRIQTISMGQFERTLIIVEEGASLEYIEGCTAILHKEESLHSAVVEVFVKQGGFVKYSTLQNWSKNVYNLVTKRAKVLKDATMMWVDINAGSKVTMKYPSCVLEGKNAKGVIYGLSIAGAGQFQDTGTKMIHLADNTKSLVVSKAIGKQNGVNNYRGLIYVSKNANNVVSDISCDALLLSNKAVAGTIPVNKINNQSAKITHEASISKLDEKALFYLKSRGFDGFLAKNLVVSGFVEEIVTNLPLEFAREFDAFIEFQLKQEKDNFNDLVDNAQD